MGLFCAFLILCAVVIGRILLIDSETDYVEAAQNHSIYSLTLAKTRGKIYDRNGNALVGGTYSYKAVVIPSADTAATLFNCLTAEQLDEISASLKGKFPFAADVPDGTCESEGITVYRVPQRYAVNSVAVHLVGYCGQDGGESGIERAYDEWLGDAAGEFTVTCRINASGQSLEGARQEVTDTTANSDRGIMLTIDRDLQNIAETAAAAHLECGAVVLLDVESSEVLAMVSLPTYDRSNIAAVLNDSRSPLMNRAVSAYNAGSVFKPVVAAAALEHGLDPDEKYECVGAVSIGNLSMGCINHTAHGEVALREAVVHSCNTYFINAARQTGGADILAMAEALGFGQSTRLGTNYSAAAGTLPSLQSLALPAELANFSFGQGKLTVTPVQVAGMFAAIARGGEYIEPYVVKGLTDNRLNIISNPVQPVTRQAMSRETAETLGECLRAAVLEGTAKAGASDSVTSAAKTGTAETGIVRNGRTINQAWYAGWFPYENPRYVCVVLAEGGTSGGSSAGPVFKEIAERVYRMRDS